MAGTMVDIALFPLDTIKTRLVNYDMHEYYLIFKSNRKPDFVLLAGSVEFTLDYQL